MKQQLLIIDDSPAIQRLITALLAEEPIAVTSASDASQGLIFAASINPDLILLDVEMPGINGFEACRRLKADPATAGIPVVFLTSVSTVEEKVRGLSLGAVDYIAKPVNAIELLARVRASLRTSRLVRLLEQKAMIDFHTGLGNQAMFGERLRAEVSLRARQGNPLSCIAIELNQFDWLTQVYGHPFTDQVLLRVAEVIADLCRDEDVACRTSGNQFLILLPHTAAAEATQRASSIRTAIAKIPFTQMGDSIAITSAAGVAEAGDAYDRSFAARATDQLLQTPATNAKNIAA